MTILVAVAHQGLTCELQHEAFSRGARVSAVALKRALNRWLFGERFVLRSPLSIEECERRIAQYNPALTPSLTTDYTAYSFGNRIVVGMQLDRSSEYPRGTPSLVGKMQSAGSGTEIVGRSGGDSITLWASVGLEIFIVPWVLAYAWEEPAILLALLMPVFLFVLTRRSADGVELTGFLQELLEAEDVLARTGDPIERG